MVGVKCRLPLIQWELPVDCNFGTVGQGAVIGYYPTNPFDQIYFLGTKIIWYGFASEQRREKKMRGEYL